MTNRQRRFWLGSEAMEGVRFEAMTMTATARAIRALKPSRRTETSSPEMALFRRPRSPSPGSGASLSTASSRWVSGTPACS